MTLRLFLGLDLPDDLRSALAVQQFLLPLPRREPVENLHLTLVFLGEVPEPVAEDLHEALNDFRAPAFTLTVEGFGLFGGDRPRLVHAMVHPDPALMTLQSRLAQLARRAGAEPEARRFLPHITLGRFPPPPPPDAMRLERAVALGQGFRSDPWEVTELTLWQSHLSAKGPHYQVLARYPLTPRPPA